MFLSNGLEDLANHMTVIKVPTSVCHCVGHNFKDLKKFITIHLCPTVGLCVQTSVYKNVGLFNENSAVGSMIIELPRPMAGS